MEHGANRFEDHGGGDKHIHDRCGGILEEIGQHCGCADERDEFGVNGNYEGRDVN